MKRTGIYILLILPIITFTKQIALIASEAGNETESQVIGNTGLSNVVYIVIAIIIVVIAYLIYRGRTK